MLEEVKKNEYPVEITENAKQFGFKAANLMFLEKIVGEFNASNDDGHLATIPALLAVSDRNINKYLRDNIPNFDEMWSNFSTLQKGKDVITPEASQALELLQNAIKKSFKDNKFNYGETPQSNKYMVRSSGNEDKVDVANPGGNESYSSLGENISESIGLVVASYISEKSLLQRLKSGEDITEHFPLTPCIVQSMVSSKSNDTPAVSGVIYTDAGHTRIQAAPGHGELIVNSKGNFDNYYITPQKKVYAEIRDKHMRLTPRVNDSTGKMEQIEEDNSFKLATNSSLDEQSAVYLHKLANFIEEKYGNMRMDIEFVYDNSTKNINVVQARAIPEGERKGMIASALDNSFISQKNPSNFKSSVITPDINSASVITKPEEILVCDTIEQALNTYLRAPSEIKAVIIKKEAPDTSHEAGMFSSRAISVFQVDDVEKAKKWVSNLGDKVLIADPQHKKLYQVNKSDYSSDLIKPGIYGSTLTPYVTPYKREALDKDTTETLWATMQTNAPVAKYNNKLLKEHLDSLSSPKFGKDLSAEKDILANLLQFSARMQKNKQISGDLLKEIMLSGSEIRNLMNSMETEPYDAKKGKYYLDVFEKFNGLITSQRKKDGLSSSVIDEMHQSKKETAYEKIYSNKGEELTDRQKEFFLELVKLDKFIMTPENKTKWQDFCFDSCKNNRGLIVSSLVKDLTKFGVQEHFLNSTFVNEYNKNKNNALANLFYEFDNGAVARNGFVEAAKTINQMEQQISEWSKPSKFEKLHAGLTKNIKELEKLLCFDDAGKLDKVLEDKINGPIAIKSLTKLIDVVDLSIKSLQNSKLYTAEQKEEQVKNFGKLVQNFENLMTKVVINDDSTQKQLVSIHKFIEEKSSAVSTKELDASPKFSVIAANIYQSGIIDDIQTGFERGFDNIPDKTLADAHTLLHQTLLSSLGKKSIEMNNDLKKNAPAIVGEMMRSFEEKSLVSGYLISSGGLRMKNPVLLTTDVEYPNIHYRYNVPLSNHSGNCDFYYNHKTKEVNVKYQLYGRDPERWKNLNEAGNKLISGITDSEITNSLAASNYFTLEVKIKKLEDVEKVFKVFNTLAQDTLNIGSGEIQDSIKDLIKRNSSTEPKLHLAINNNQTELFKYLLERGEDINVNSSDGKSLIEHAVKSGNTKIAELILEKKNFKFEESMLLDVISSKNKSMVSLVLAQEGVNVNAKDSSSQESVLYKAVATGKKEIVELILAKEGVDVNAKNKSGESVLHKAVATGNKEIVELILAKEGIDINTKDNYQESVLYKAIRTGQKEIVELILAKEGLDINAYNKKRNPETALQHCVLNSKEEMVKLLLADERINVNERDSSGQTILHNAINGEENIIKLVLENKKIDVNAKDNDGKTALHIAIENGDEKAVNILLFNKKIDINVLDNDGNSALKMAMESGKDSIVKLLVAHNMESKVATNEDKSIRPLNRQNSLPRSSSNIRTQ